MNKEQAEKYAAFLRFVISQFIQSPDQLQVQPASSVDVEFGIRCAKNDEALIIGRSGRNIKALSELVNSYVALDRKRSVRLHVMTEKAEGATLFGSRKKSSWSLQDTQDLLATINRIHEWLFPGTIFTIRAEQDSFEACRSIISIETREPINMILMTAYDQIFRAIGKFRGRTISINNTHEDRAL